MKYYNAEKLGIDIGNTIIDKKKVPFPDAFRVIKRLIDERYHDNVYLISRVTPEQEIKAELFVRSELFNKEVGIPISHVFYCRERHEKAAIAWDLGITHYIDDNPEVMSYMINVPERILFNPNPDHFNQYRRQLEGVAIVNSWLEVEQILL